MCISVSSSFLPVSALLSITQSINVNAFQSMTWHFIRNRNNSPNLSQQRPSYENRHIMTIIPLTLVEVCVRSEVLYSSLSRSFQVQSNGQLGTELELSIN